MNLIVEMYMQAVHQAIRARLLQCARVPQPKPLAAITQELVVTGINPTVLLRVR